MRYAAGVTSSSSSSARNSTASSSDSSRSPSTLAALHVGGSRAPPARELYHRAAHVLRVLDLELLVRLQLLAALLLVDDLRARHLELIALAPQRLDEDREV